ncbi:class I SAM-dependent methyltransferase [Candidatus Bathyarchaeota archaeon]|nr:class I SAM-dependent methyltransferase [Candidatus Bathyarchaeota archaeon]
MLKLVELKPGELLYDLGSGDGRGLIIAVQDFGANAIGVELNENLVKSSREMVRKLNLTNRIQIIHGDLFNVNLSKADVVMLYLFPDMINQLKLKLKRELKDGARVVSHDYGIPGWVPTKVEMLSKSWLFNKHKIFVYKIPGSLGSVKANEIEKSRLVKFHRFIYGLIHRR